MEKKKKSFCFQHPGLSTKAVKKGKRAESPPLICIHEQHWLQSRGFPFLQCLKWYPAGR